MKMNDSSTVSGHFGASTRAGSGMMGVERMACLGYFIWKQCVSEEIDTGVWREIKPWRAAASPRVLGVRVGKNKRTTEKYKKR